MCRIYLTHLTPSDRHDTVCQICISVSTDPGHLEIVSDYSGWLNRDGIITGKLSSPLTGWPLDHGSVRTRYTDVSRSDLQPNQLNYLGIVVQWKTDWQLILFTKPMRITLAYGTYVRTRITNSYKFIQKGVPVIWQVMHRRLQQGTCRS